jgi:hypothetical protein
MDDPVFIIAEGLATAVGLWLSSFLVKLEQTERLDDLQD